MQPLDLIPKFSTQRMNQLNDNPTISIIPNISQPNQLLPKNIQLSKSIQHLLLSNFQDIESESSQLQQLYNNEQNQIKRYSINKQVGVNTKSLDRINFNKKNHSQLINLWDFFMENSEDVVFISRLLVLLMSQNQKLIFKKLINYKKSFEDQIQKSSYQKYFQLLTKICTILYQNPKFPYLCPQINENVLQSSSFQNIFHSSQKHLSFNDNFQSSNILMVKCKQSNSINNNENPTYYISTRFDYQTRSYGQWFYFSVKRNQMAKQHNNVNVIQNDKKKQNNNNNNNNKYRFVICNMTKNFSMLGKNMKISVCRSGKWCKQGSNILYYETCFQRYKKRSTINTSRTSNQKIPLINKNHECFYTLQFQLQINIGQQIYVSYNQPYSFSRVSKLLDGFTKTFYEHQLMVKQNNQKQNSKTLDRTIQNDKQTAILSLKKQKNNQPSIYFKRQIICETPLKNQVQCVTFVKKKQNKLKKIFQQSFLQQENQSRENQQSRKVIILLARSHPIQTAGSYVIQGFMKILFMYAEYQNDPKKKQQLREYFNTESRGKLFESLLKNFIIKIIPMLNPDGVVLGNSRCNFNGFDLNRQWKKSDKDFCPQIYHLKKYLLRYKQRIQMVIDLHGHSRKNNVFAYGIHDFKNPYSTRQFPFILSKLSQKNFLFRECRFTRLSDLSYESVSKQKSGRIKQNSKQGTARIWLYRKLNIPNIFTIQNSYCGSIYSKYHYDCGSYNQIGYDILMGISLYFVNFIQKQNQKKKKLKRKIQKDKSKNKNFVLASQCEEKQMNSSEKNQIQSFQQLRKEFMLDLKSKQQNISMGMVEIDSSQSEEEQRIDKKKNGEKSDVSLMKKRIQSKSQKNIPIQPPTFKKTPRNISSRYQQYETIQQQIKPCKQKLVEPIIKYIPTEIRNKLIQRTQRIRQAYITKSLSNLQKNSTMSIVQLGWNNKTQLNDSRNNNNTPMPNSDYSINNISINQSVHKMKQMVGMCNSHINNQKKIMMKRLENKGVTGEMIKEEKRQGVTKGFKNNNTTHNNSNKTIQVLQKFQAQKNIKDFMKKMDFNKKQKIQQTTIKKIQKYKQIISRINGNKNDYAPHLFM